MRLKVTVLVCASALGGVLVGSARSPGETSRPEQPELTQQQKLCYGVGYYLGRDVREGMEADGIEASRDIIVRGFAHGIRAQRPVVDEETLDDVMYAVHAEMQTRLVSRLLEEDAEFKQLHDENLDRSRAFHAEFGRRAGVITLESGIQYRVLSEGDGDSPGLEATVIASYVVKHLDGRVLRSGERAAFEVDDVVEGGSIVLQMMKPGDRWEVALPPDLAYGPAGQPPDVQPNESLLVEVELHQVRGRGGS